MKLEMTTLRKLLEDYHHGKILLPQFQRDFVWKSRKIRNLLDSLLRGYPIGAFYLWRPEGGTREPKPKAFGGGKIAPEFNGYLIDGQQRLTSLEAAFGLYSGEDKGGVELECFLDLAATDQENVKVTRLFVSRAGDKGVGRRVEDGDSTLIPLKDLWKSDHDNRAKIQEAVRDRGWSDNDQRLAMEWYDGACKMLDCQVPCATIDVGDDKVAIEVFDRLNRGGTALRQGDVLAAQLARAKAVNVLAEMREFVGSERQRRLGFGFSFAFRALVLFHRQSAQFATLRPRWVDAPGPHKRSLMESWNATAKAVDKRDKLGHHIPVGSRRRTSPPGRPGGPA